MDITEFFDRKCEAMRAYRSELCEFPHPRSIKMLEALATMRDGTVGVEKAEPVSYLLNRWALILPGCKRLFFTERIFGDTMDIWHYHKR